MTFARDLGNAASAIKPVVMPPRNDTSGGMGAPESVGATAVAPAAAATPAPTPTAPAKETSISSYATGSSYSAPVTTTQASAAVKQNPTDNSGLYTPPKGGLLGFLYNAVATPFRGAGKALSAGAAGLNRAYTDVVSHPVSAAATWISASEKGAGQGKGFWYTAPWNGPQGAWAVSNHISPGQAVLMANNNDAFLSGGGTTTYVDPTNPQDVKAFFAKPEQKYGSGAVDALFQWYGAGAPGKLAKVAKAAEFTKPVTGSTDIGKLLDSRPTAKFFNYAQGKAPSEMINNSSIKASSRPAELAYIFSNQTDIETKRLALQIATTGPGTPMNAAALAKLAESDSKTMEVLVNSQNKKDFWLQQTSDLHNHPEAYQDIMTREMQRQSDLISASKTQLDINQRIEDLSGTMFNSAPGGLGQNLRTSLKTAFKGADKWGYSDYVQGLSSSSGDGWLHQVIHRGYFNTPLRVMRSMGDQWPKGWVQYGDRRSYAEVGAFLNRSRSLAPEERKAFMDTYMGAKNDAESAKAVTHIEMAAMKSDAARWGYTYDEAVDLVNETLGRRGELMNQIVNPTGQSFSSAVDAAGQKIDIHYLGEDGVPVHAPILPEMLRNGQPMYDMDLWNDTLKANAKYMPTIRQGIQSGERFLEKMGDSYSSLWKNSVLIRGGFTPRILADFQGRTMAKYGAASTLSAMGTGIKNLMRNQVSKYKMFTTPSSAANEAGRVEADLTFMKARQAQNDAERAAGHFVAPEEEVTDEMISQTQQRLDLLNQMPKVLPGMQRWLGDEDFKYRGFDLMGSMAGDDGELYRSMTGADQMMAGVFGRERDQYENFLAGTGQWADINPLDPNKAIAGSHLPAWSHALNNQIGNSPLMKILVQAKAAGKDGTQAAKAWLNTPEGRAYAARVPEYSHSPSAINDWIGRLGMHLDHYTQDNPVLVDTMASGKKVTPKRLEQLFPTPSDRPPINGEMLQYNVDGGDVMKLTRKWQERMHKVVGEIPLTTMSYHPTFDIMYKGHMQTQIDQLLNQTGEDASHINFSVQDQARMSNAARKQALADLQNIMYDVSVKSTAAHATRYIFPFFNAQQEILYHWAKIAIDDPSVAIHANQLWNSPEKAGMVVDQNGDQATADTPADQKYVRFQIPDAISSRLNLGPMNGFSVSKQSANSILQGKNYYVPGAGPLVAIAVGQIAKSNPGILDDKAVQLFLPYGAQPSPVSAVLPTWMKRVKTMASSVDDPTYAKTYAQIFQAETVRRAHGLRSTDPTPAEIATRTKQVLAVDALSSVLLPFSAHAIPGTQHGDSQAAGHPYQFFIDEYNRMKQQDPKNAQTNFYNKYGSDMFVFAMSMSKSNADVPATFDGMVESQKYADIIQKDPQLARVIIDPRSYTQAFDQSAYQYEKQQSLGPGSDLTLRQDISPADAIKQNKIDLGWTQYTKLNNAIKAAMVNRGIVKLTDAPDLNALKKQFIFETQQPGSALYNPDWYGAFNTNVNWSARIAGMKEIASDKDLLSNPARSDIQVLNIYLQGRNAIQQQLQARPSHTLTASANADLASAWEQFTGQLTTENTVFHDMYERYLATDPVNVG